VFHPHLLLELGFIKQLVAGRCPGRGLPSFVIIFPFRRSVILAAGYLPLLPSGSAPGRCPCPAWLTLGYFSLISVAWKTYRWDPGCVNGNCLYNYIFGCNSAALPSCSLAFAMLQGHFFGGFSRFPMVCPCCSAGCHAILAALRQAARLIRDPLCHLIGFFSPCYPAMKMSRAAGR